MRSSPMSFAIWLLLAQAAMAQAGLQSSPVWTFESNASNAYFGLQSTTAGDVNGDGYSDILFSAPYYSGAEAGEGKVWCFLGGPNGPEAAAHWVKEGNQAGARFGWAARGAGDVNSDGYDDVVVGADGWSNAQVDEGAVFVYYGSPAGLPANPSWTKESNSAGIRFGQGAMGAGDVNNDGYDDIVIGAPEYSNGQTREGRAYLYLGGPSGVASSAAWTQESDNPMSLYGATMSPAGDVNADGFDDIVIGALTYENGQTNEGAVWLYRGNTSGLTTIPYWRIESNVENRYFGETLGCAGDLNGDGYSDISIGWSLSPIDVVWIYEGGPGGTDTTADHSMVGDNTNSYNGGSFTGGDVNGDGYADFIIGDGHADGAEADQGSLRLFQGGPTFPNTLETTLWGELSQTISEFGLNCGPAGDVNGDGYGDVIVMAPSYDNGQANEGKAYVYLGEADKTAGSVDWTDEGNQTSAEYCFAMALGDWNGDGYSDLTVGSRLHDGDQTDEGYAFVYSGDWDGIGVISDWSKDGDQVAGQFGTSVANAGDVDGDGYEDLLVGAPLYDGDATNGGQAFLISGSRGGLLSVSSWTSSSDQSNANYGAALASAGDVNGDGFGDIIVGSPNYETEVPLIDEGIAFVYYGSASGPSTDASWSVTGGQANANFGTSVACAGDVNADGYSDVIIGAPRADNGQTNEGVAYIYHGSSTGLSEVATTLLQSNRSDSNFGGSVSAAGDVNGDGYSDVIVGASSWSNGSTSEGAAFVYLGSAAGINPTAAWSREGNQENARAGAEVGCAGDVNGDGYSDVMVGATQYMTTVPNEGRCTVYFGSPSGLGLSTTWMVNGGQSSARFASALAGSADINGDGFSDIAIGAPNYDAGQNNEGLGFVYFGNEGGLDRACHQLTSLSRDPLALLGMNDDTDSMTLQAYGRTAMGRGKVQVQWTAAEVGSDLAGWNTWPTAYDTGVPDTDTGSRVAFVTGPLTMLDDDSAYHWRMRMTSDSPFFPHTPWFSMPGNAKTETDFRTARVISGAPDGEVVLGSALRFTRVWPNPSADVMSFGFALPASGEAQLAIFDALGRRIANVAHGPLEAGSHIATWNGLDASGSRAPAGVYFARLCAGGDERVRKIVIAR